MTIRLLCEEPPPSDDKHDDRLSHIPQDLMPNLRGCLGHPDAKALRGASWAVARIVRQWQPHWDCGMERAVLLARTSTTGNGWNQLSRWNTARPVGEWEGTITTAPGGRVQKIALPWKNLRGVLPTELFHLAHLTVLNLQGNFLKGALPRALPSSLEVLNLGGPNRWAGGIPSEWGSSLPNLRELKMISCGLDGPLPGALPASLEVLALGDKYSMNTNHFAGGIPSEWGALVNLRSLYLVSCGLDGTIPVDALGKLTKLNVLSLLGNAFEGKLEASAALAKRLPDCLAWIS
jgi:hypothetical protein